MKLKLTLLSLLCLLSTSSFAQSKPLDAFEQNRRLGRGVNIIGYDQIWWSRDKARIQPKHFHLLKEAGFNSVRINLHPFRHMSATNNWKIRDSWFEVADWAVAQARGNGLNAILDLHEFNVLGEDPAGNKEKFLAAWRQLSAHYQSAPDTVLFEVLNEPNKKLTPELWNDYLQEALTIIRDKNPAR